MMILRGLLVVLCVCTLLVSCASPAGKGAAAGAATGAVVAGPFGAAAGAAGGAIIGAVVGKREASRYREPRGGFPVAKPTSRDGYVVSPYTGRLYDVRRVPSGALVRDVDADQLFRNP